MEKKPSLNILISGLGVAGPALAYWLLRTPYVNKITIIERDATERTKGQAIDIRDAGVPIMEQMNLLSEVRARGTQEKGLSFVDAAGRSWATFMATGDQTKQTFTSEFEILRGDLVTLLYEQIKGDARIELLLGQTVSSLSQTPTHVDVAFSSGRPSETFDLVLAADGLGSPIRGWVYDQSPKEHIYSIGTWLALWTVPHDLLGPAKIAQFHLCGDNKGVLVRPDRYDTTRASFMICGGKSPTSQVIPTYYAAKRQGVSAIKNLVKREFANAKWIVPEMLASIDAADDFWASEIGQVRIPELYKGRVAFVGDAGYCPSPFTGLGTTTALVGSYVLAGELLNAQGDVDKALKAYQDYIQPKLKEVQSIPPGAPDIFVPKTSWGVTLVLSIVAFFKLIRLDAAASGVGSLFPSWNKNIFKLPEYKWIKP